MINRRLLVLLALAVACDQAPRRDAGAKKAAGPQFTATVVSIRIASDGGKKVTNHEIVISDGRARKTAEQDVWRLFDTRAGTITTVDEIDQTVRTDALPALLSRRRAALAAAIPAHYPRAKLTRGASKPILGRLAQQHTIELGAYRRELWLARHPSIPDALFAMMHAADAPVSPIAAIMRSADEALLEATGFPLVDRTEFPVGEGKAVIERTVTGVASRQVSESLLTIPRGYRDVTPKPAPAAGRDKKKRTAA